MNQPNDKPYSKIEREARINEQVILDDDTSQWGLEYCKKCKLITNHDDNGCLKCRSKTADPTLRKKLAAIIDEELGAGNTPEWLIDDIITLFTEVVDEKLDQNDRQHNDIDTRIGMLRQWLNEDRIIDHTKMVTNEELHIWLDEGIAKMRQYKTEGKAELEAQLKAIKENK